MKAIIGKKVGMSQIFDENGHVIPVTVIEAGPCVVTQKKTAEKDGYEAVQLGYEDVAEKKLSKPEVGHLNKAGVSPKKHVIISCGGQKPPDDTVTQAAQLAAYYAETGGGQNIPVDVTAVKQVKKTPGGKPGMVIYHTYRTAIVNPYPDVRVDPLNAESK